MLRFQCPECGLGDHEVRHLIAGIEIYCIVCLEEDGRLIVSDVPRPFDAQRNQGGRSGTQCHGINSSMRFCGQPFTRRVSRSVK